MQNNLIRIKNNEESHEELAQNKYIMKMSNIVNTNTPSKNIVLNKNNLKLSEDYTFDKNKSYRKSNLLDLLTFLCKKNLMNNVRIVCHSQLMKKFLKNMDIVLSNKKSTCMRPFCTKKIKKNYTNNLSELVDNENLWTLFLQNQNTYKAVPNKNIRLAFDNKNKNFNISISRHGYTYANVVKGTSAQQYEKDAKLTIYGILTALIHGDELIEKEKNEGLISTPNLIYVSVLIRTWMTAICLYLPHNTEKIFTLIVSPFIRETGKGYPGLDNEPDEIPLQIENIIIFLEYLRLISKIEFSNTIINKNLNNINTFFNELGRINIYTPENNYSIYLNDNTFQSEIENSKEYFNITNLDDLQCKNNSITKLKIFHGKNKPLKNDKEIFTRWCEPFAKQEKFLGFGQNTCASRMKKIA